jgi:Protein of unknown function (DUF2905)
MDSQTGKYIIVAGIILVLAGSLIYFIYGSFRWLGHLPGDVIVRKKNFSFYFPEVTMIILSILLTLITNVIRRCL